MSVNANEDGVGAAGVSCKLGLGMLGCCSWAWASIALAIVMAGEVSSLSVCAV
jgi:hypothetical protein